MKNVFRTLLLTAMLGCLSLLAACSQPQRAAAPLPDLSIGVVGFTQPTDVLDLMAGYIPDNQHKISGPALARIDTTLRDALNKTKRAYTFIPADTAALLANKERSRTNSALAHWVEVGKSHKVDLLIVPMIINWDERQGSDLGVTQSAAVISDIFLVDTRGKGNLLQRSYFDEKQASLSNNLLEIGTFFKRGGKWITAEQLEGEAINKAIQEFGL